MMNAGKCDLDTKDTTWQKRTRGGNNYFQYPVVHEFGHAAGNSYWILNTNELSDFHSAMSPVDLFKVEREFIYGHKEYYQSKLLEEYKTPEQWFILDTKNQQPLTYESEAKFLMALQERNLNEKLLKPDVVLEEFRKKIVLNWFPDSVKTKLNTGK